MTLQLVVNTGNIQIITVEDRLLQTLMDLDRDHVKWTRGSLHMDMKNPYSPATMHFREQLKNCPNTNSQVRESQKYSETIEGIRERRGRVRIAP